MLHRTRRRLAVSLAVLCAGSLLAACIDDPGIKRLVPSTDVGDAGDTAVDDTAVDMDADAPFERAPAPPNDGVYGFVNGCYAIEGYDGDRDVRVLATADGGAAFAFSESTPDEAAHFFMRASDLATYLLYDAGQHYVTAEPDEAGVLRLERVAALVSELDLLDDTFRSPAEWIVEVSARDPERFQLRNYATDRYLSLDGLVDSEADAAILSFFAQDGCAEFPELTRDAVGEVRPRQWEDGDVYGIAEMHTHLMTSFAFGGGGMFHGAPFHRLGVEHALGSCEPFHGEGGRRDLIGVFFNMDRVLDVASLLPTIVAGESEEFSHHTEGYPQFTDWPNVGNNTTHQAAYYVWLERAYLSGVRLLVQHATGSSLLCEFVTGIGSQPVRYSCNDMVSVDRSIAEVRNLERYIDAQSGGPGMGWFRVVESPAEARDVINQGKMAVVLGIEISNLFDCFLTPPEGYPACDAQMLREALDRYHDLGVRVVFPVHKFDNAFAPGDGSGGIIELGNLVNSGHYSNLVDDCPLGLTGFDNGDITFGGLNRPRDAYDAPAPLDMSGFAQNPVATLLPLLADLREPSIPGNFCQNATVTELGETLLVELMRRGMIPDIAHLPQHAVLRALEMLEDNAYPATSTHRENYEGRLYALGGLSPVRIARCADAEHDGALSDNLIARAAQRAEFGAYGADGLSIDVNGFAPYPDPRFGQRSDCQQPQPRPLTYPFTSYDGDIEFTQPHVGDRTIDFNTEGMIHIGLIPEIIEEMRRDGASDEELEPLFRSAEAYLRMWEYAEVRGAQLRGE